MRAVFSIASIAFRSSVRSRLFAFLAVLLLITVIGLPLTVKGDGTPEGQCRVLVVYTLGFAVAILGIATLWLGGAAVSQEVEGKTIRLIAVKPVRTVQVWLGKWLGLLALNGVLLAFVGLVVALQVQGVLRSHALQDTDRHRLRRDLLVGRRVWNPASALTAPAVSAGETLRWIFPVDDAMRRRSPQGAPCDLLLRFRLHAVYRSRDAASGAWTVGTADRPTWFTYAMEEYAEGVYRLALPSDLDLDRADSVTVTFRHTGNPKTSAPIIFDPGDSVTLLVRETGFGSNLARALVILLGLLALLAAFGVTVGTLFSFPVATFVAAAGLLLSVTVQYVTVVQAAGPGHHHGDGSAPPSLFHQAGIGLQRGFKFVTAPVMQFSPLSSLSDGRLVSGRETARALGILFLLYPGALAAAGAIVLSRRELAR